MPSSKEEGEKMMSSKRLYDVIKRGAGRKIMTQRGSILVNVRRFPGCPFKVCRTELMEKCKKKEDIRWITIK
ncbi:hypothetical protein ACOJQI_06760 [Bacillus salacetis]|uniref:hypothetical protein n=1 Tax=Bacillus salacetis TaxID=2315464 RepID=UPI003B9F512A